MPHLVIIVTPDPESRGWRTSTRGTPTAGALFPTKAAAVAAAEDIAHLVQRGRVIVKRADGQIESDQTYERHPGPSGA